MERPPITPSNEALSNEAGDIVDLPRAALSRAGSLLVDLADQATKLAALLAESGRSKNLAGGLCRRAELARLLGRKLAVSADAKSLVTATLVNDAILSLDGIAVDIEYAADFAGDVQVKNQVARSRLAVTTAGCAIEDALHALSIRA